jgi:hypothetical protein
MIELSKSADPSTMGELPEVTYHNPTEIVELPKQEKVYTPEDLWIHINAVEEEVKAELNEIKKVLNKLVTEKLDK